MTLRVDLQIISDWIPDNAHVLDLGCGNGSLLKHLQQRNVTGYGLEIDNSKFSECIAGGVNVTKNGTEKANISSPEFKKALFGIWLSKHSVQEKLKNGMLGK